MGKNISQPEFKDKTYITSFLFKLKSKPAAIYQSLGGFAINVSLAKSPPLGVDTEEDYLALKKIMEYKN